MFTKKINIKPNIKLPLLLLMFSLSALAYSHRPIEATEHDARQSRLRGNVSANDNAVDFTSFGGSFAAGDYLRFPQIDFDAGNFRRLMVFLSAPASSAGKVIEIRVDSPNSAAVGQFTLIDTYGSQTFVPRFAEIDELSGTRDVFFYFPQATDTDLDFFVFTEHYFPIYRDTGIDDPEYTYLYELIAAEKASGRHDERMNWWRDASFGMFIHFGVYALAGGATLDPPMEGVSWQPGQDNLSKLNGATPVWRQTNQAEWIMREPQRLPLDIYKEFIARPFNPYAWDAEEIIRLARSTGMRYLVITARHHDGFSMHDTQVRTHRDWGMLSVANHGNWERDIIKELALAAQATYGTEHEVIFGAYLTVPDWGDHTQYPLWGVIPGGGGGRLGDATETFVGDTPEERERNRAEYLSRLKGQMRELIVDYGARIIWFDDANMMKITSAQSYAIYNFARSLNPDVILNNRFTTFRRTAAAASRTGHIDYDTPEHRLLTSRPKNDFEVCYTLNNSWGYRSNDHAWKSPARVVEMLTQTVGLNGNLLLNIGPDGAGRVPQPSVDIFRIIGRWMDVVGESIHDTRGGFYTTEELPAGVFSTVREGRLFFHLLPHFTAATLMLPAPNNRILGARVMNTDAPVQMIDAGGYLFFDFSDLVRDPLSTVIEVQVEGMPAPAPYPAESTIRIVRPGNNAVLEAANFIVSGATLTEQVDEVEIRLFGDEIGVITIPAVINDHSWSARIDTSNFPSIVNPLTILALLKHNGQYTDMVACSITYGILIDYAKGRPATVSSQFNDNLSGSGLTDGNISSRWQSAGDDTQPHFIVQLGELAVINRVEMSEWQETFRPLSGTGFRAERYTVSVSTSAEGDDWQVVYEGGRIGANGVAAFANPAAARRVKVTFSEWFGNNQTGAQPSILEVSVFNIDAVHFGTLRNKINETGFYPGITNEDVVGNSYPGEGNPLTDAYFEARRQAIEISGNQEATQADVNEALRNLRDAVVNMRGSRGI